MLPPASTCDCILAAPSDGTGDLAGGCVSSQFHCGSSVLANQDRTAELFVFGAGNPPHFTATCFAAQLAVRLLVIA